MGRRKKYEEEASTEGKKYVLDTVRRYHQMKSDCTELENKRPSLIQRGNIDVAAFDVNDLLSENTFVDPVMTEADQKVMDQYLADKEKVYLLEYGISILEEGQRSLAEDMFVKKMSRMELAEKWHFSQSTLTRHRKEIINSLALQVDAYMFWKAQTLFEQ
ncbi:MAG: hypothetical protein ACI4OO_01560 [Otoolea sp.]